MPSMFYLHTNTTVTEFISTEVGALQLTTETSLLSSQSNTTQKDVNQKRTLMLASEIWKKNLLTPEPKLSKSFSFLSPHGKRLFAI